MPDQTGAPTVIDSAGGAFQFPTTDNHAFGLLWAGGTVPVVAGQPSRPAVPGGVDYAAAGHGLLAMDSNNGVTLDLNAVRRLHPSHEVARLRCVVGNAFAGTRPVRPKADAVVLVDGKPRFRRRGQTDADGAIRVDVPLGPDDRFLTLAVTDGGDGTGYAWATWGDPAIDLAAR